MNFVSKEFIFFFLIFSCFYFSLSKNLKIQNIVLLLASLIFYGWWDYRFLGLLIFTAALDFHIAKLIHKYNKYALRLLVLSVVLNLSVLSYFKYFNFFIDTLNLALGKKFDFIEVLLPIGISFYTFQSMSYVIDVYRKNMLPIEKVLDFILCVSFFPHLVAGPIIRAHYLYPQIATRRVLSLEIIYNCLPLLLVGFFKKMVIADNCALVVDSIFHNPTPSSLDILLGTAAFTMQIYGDFSGYSDIARAISRSIGIEIPENFRLPYFSFSPSDFWQRWHISLSSWLKDYLYIPLGGNRNGSFKTYLNLTITMVLGGLWHGASWHFVLWGFYHGILLTFYKLLKLDAVKKKSIQCIMIPIFFIFTCFGWLIFRVDSVEQLVNFLKILFLKWNIESQISKTECSKLIVIIVSLFSFQLYQFLKNEMEPWKNWNYKIRIVWLIFLLYSIIFLGIFNTRSFIYFQF